VDKPEEPEELTFEKRFGWYVVVNRLTNNNVNEHDKVFKKKIIEVLNQLAYLLALDKEIERQQKQQSLKN
jgi:hypothetical protein